MQTKTAIQIVEAKGYAISSMSYLEAENAAKMFRCTFLYDAYNGDVGRAYFNESTGRVHHAVTCDGKIWITC